MDTLRKHADELAAKIFRQQQELQALKKAYPELRVAVRPDAGSILNGYREGDIGFYEAKDMISRLIFDFCPQCAGEGKWVPPWAEGVLPDPLHCVICCGLGQVRKGPPSAFGHHVRSYREQVCGLGLREAAKLWGVLPSILTQVETNRLDTDWRPPDYFEYQAEVRTRK